MSGLGVCLSVYSNYIVCVVCVCVVVVSLTFISMKNSGLFCKQEEKKVYIRIAKLFVENDPNCDLIFIASRCSNSKQDPTI